MKRSIHLRIELLAVFVCWMSLQTLAQLKKEDIAAAIDPSRLEHPYLYFTEQEKPELIRRIQTDPESNAIFRRMEAEARMLLHMPVDMNIPVQGKNTRAGWSEQDRDRKYETWYNTNRNNAFKLAFLYQMTGEQKYADKAFEFADAFCDLTTWTMRAHEFPIIYSRIMPWNVPDDQVNFSFDHYNGDSGRLMAAVYDWLYPGLTEAQRDRIRGALLEKVITRVRGNYEFHWWATAYRCNWCGVCNSGVGLAGLALLREHPQFVDVVAESYNRINSLLNELGVDGGWQEGGGYWNYGVHTSSFFADALKRMTASRYNLFENERLKSNPVTFPLYISVPGGKSLNFADSGGGSLIGSPHLINKLAAETGSPEAAWYRNDFMGAGNDVFDIIWPRPDVQPAPPAHASKHFRTIDWWVMRSDFKDKSKVMVAGKAGMNDDPHHGHLDIGHFVIHWQGEYYICEPGRVSYDEKFFDDARWDYIHASSEGHNVVFVNGEKQIPGKMRKQPYNYDIGGKVLEFRPSAMRDYVLMDPSNAYPKKELLGWRRHVTLDKPQVTFVLDEVQSKPGSEIEVRFHPGVAFEIRDKYVMMEGAEGKMAMIPVMPGDYTIRPGKHAVQFVNATSPFSWIDYLGTVVKSSGDKTLVASIFVPVANAAEAERIARSAQVSQRGESLVISVQKDGKKYVYDFKRSEDGYVLK